MSQSASGRLKSPMNRMSRVGVGRDTRSFCNSSRYALNSLLVDQCLVQLSGERYVTRRIRFSDITCIPSDSMTPFHSGPTEVEDCSLPAPNMAATKTDEQGKAYFSDL